MNRIMLICAYSGILALAVVVRYSPAFYAANLHPSPEAVEYATTAVTLLEKGTFATIINHTPYPPRYPFGFPLLIVPVLAVLGPAAYNAIHAVLLFSVIAVAAAMLLAQRLFGHVAAIVAGLILCSGKQFVEQQINSDMVALALILLAALLVIAALDGKIRYALLFCAGFLAGLAVTVRYIEVLQLGVLAIVVLLLLRHSPRRMAGALLALGAGASIWILPLLLWQWRVFGNPLTTTYQYWDPAYTDLTRTFSLSYLISPPLPDAPTPLTYYAKTLSGMDLLFWRPRFVLAIFFGATVLILGAGKRERRGLLLLGLMAAMNLGTYLTHVFEYTRYIVLTGAALAIIGGYGISMLVRLCLHRPRSPETRNALSMVIRLGCGALAFLQLVSLAESPLPTIGRSYIYTTKVERAEWTARPRVYEIMRYLDVNLPTDALLVSGQPGPLLQYYVLKDTSRTYMPVTRQGSLYADTKPARDWPVADERPDLILAAIRQHTGVYLIDDSLTRRQPEPLDVLRANFEFREVGVMPRSAAVPLTLFQLLLREQ